MRFKGDIIITDPCYIIKSPEDYAKELGIPFPAYPKYTEDIKAYDKAMSEYRSFTNKYDDWRLGIWILLIYRKIIQLCYIMQLFKA